MSKLTVKYASLVETYESTHTETWHIATTMVGSGAVMYTT